MCAIRTKTLGVKLNKPTEPELQRRRRLDLNQRKRRTGSRPQQHVCRGDARPLKRLLTIGRGWPTHIPFHIRQPRATGTRSHVGAGRTSWKIAGANRANFVQLRRVSPNFSELLPPEVAAGQRKLDARKDVAVRRNVTAGVAGAAREAVHNVFAGWRWRGAEFLHVAHQFLIAENLFELRARHP